MCLENTAFLLHYNLLVTFQVSFPSALQKFNLPKRWDKVHGEIWLYVHATYNHHRYKEFFRLLLIYFDI